MARNPATYFGVPPQNAGPETVLLLLAKCLGSPEWNPKIQLRTGNVAESWAIFGRMVTAFRKGVATAAGLTLAAAFEPTVGYRRKDVLYDVAHHHVYLVPPDTFRRMVEAFGGFDPAVFASAIVAHGPAFERGEFADRGKAWDAVVATLAASKPKPKTEPSKTAERKGA